MQNYENEEWRRIEGYEYYEISNYGRVRTDRPICTGNGANTLIDKGVRHLKPFAKSEGYMCVSLCGEIGSNTPKQKYIHRLLWQAFVGDIPEGYVIDHINRNRSDNRLDNLRVATQGQNMINCKPRREAKVKYRGVNPCGNDFIVRITLRGVRTTIGRFATAEKAALAYNEAAKRLHGRFAVLNEITNIREVA